MDINHWRMVIGCYHHQSFGSKSIDTTMTNGRKGCNGKSSLLQTWVRIMIRAIIIALIIQIHLSNLTTTNKRRTDILCSGDVESNPGPTREQKEVIRHTEVYLKRLQEANKGFGSEWLSRSAVSSAMKQSASKVSSILKRTISRLVSDDRFKEGYSQSHLDMMHALGITTQELYRRGKSPRKVRRVLQATRIMNREVINCKWIGSNTILLQGSSSKGDSLMSLFWKCQLFKSEENRRVVTIKATEEAKQILCPRGFIMSLEDRIEGIIDDISNIYNSDQRMSVRDYLTHYFAVHFTSDQEPWKPPQFSYQKDKATSLIEGGRINQLTFEKMMADSDAINEQVRQNRIKFQQTKQLKDYELGASVDSKYSNFSIPILIEGIPTLIDDVAECIEHLGYKTINDVTMGDLFESMLDIDESLIANLSDVVLDDGCEESVVDTLKLAQQRNVESILLSPEGKDAYDDIVRKLPQGLRPAASIRQVTSANSNFPVEAGVILNNIQYIKDLSAKVHILNKQQLSEFVTKADQLMADSGWSEQGNLDGSIYNTTIKSVIGALCEKLLSEVSSLNINYALTAEDFVTIKGKIDDIISFKPDHILLQLSMPALKNLTHQIKAFSSSAIIPLRMQESTAIEMCTVHRNDPLTFEQPFMEVLEICHLTLEYSPNAFLIEYLSHNRSNLPLLLSADVDFIIARCRSGTPEQIKVSLNRFKGTIGQFIGDYLMRSCDQVLMYFDESTLNEPGYQSKTANLPSTMKKYLDQAKLGEPDGVFVAQDQPMMSTNAGQKNDPIVGVVETSMITSNDPSVLCNKAKAKVRDQTLSSLPDNWEDQVENHYKLVRDKAYMNKEFSKFKIGENDTDTETIWQVILGTDDNLLKVIIMIDLSSNERRWPDVIRSNPTLINLAHMSHIAQLVGRMSLQPTQVAAATAEKMRAMIKRRPPIDLNQIDMSTNLDGQLEWLKSKSGPLSKSVMSNFILGRGHVGQCLTQINDLGIEKSVDDLLEAVIVSHDKNNITTGQSYDLPTELEKIRLGMQATKSEVLEDKHQNEVLQPFPLFDLKLMDDDDDRDDFRVFYIPSLYGLRHLFTQGLTGGKVSKRARKFMQIVANHANLRRNMFYSHDSSLSVNSKYFNSVMGSCYSCIIGMTKHVRTIAGGISNVKRGMVAKCLIACASICQYTAGHLSTLNIQLLMDQGWLTKEDESKANDAWRLIMEDEEQTSSEPDEVESSMDVIDDSDQSYSGSILSLSEILSSSEDDYSDDNALDSDLDCNSETRSMESEPTTRFANGEINHAPLTFSTEIHRQISKACETAFKDSEWTDSQPNGYISYKKIKEMNKHISVIMTTTVSAKLVEATSLFLNCFLSCLSTDHDSSDSSKLRSTIDQLGTLSGHNKVECATLYMVCLMLMRSVENYSQLEERQSLEDKIISSITDSGLSAMNDDKCLIAFRTCQSIINDGTEVRLRKIQSKHDTHHITNELVDEAQTLFKEQLDRFILLCIKAVERRRQQVSNLIQKAERESKGQNQQKMWDQVKNADKAISYVEGKLKVYKIELDRRLSKNILFGMIRRGKFLKQIKLLTGGSKLDDITKKTISLSSYNKWMNMSDIMKNQRERPTVAQEGNMLMDHFFNNDQTNHQIKEHGNGSNLRESMQLLRSIVCKSDILVEAGKMAIVYDTIRSNFPTGTFGKYKVVRVRDFDLYIVYPGKKVKEGNSFPVIVYSNSKHYNNILNPSDLEAKQKGNTSRLFHTNPKHASFMSQTFLHACLLIVELEQSFKEDFGGNAEQELQWMAEYICKMRQENKASTSAMCSSLVFLDQAMASTCLNGEILLSKIESRPQTPASAVIYYHYYNAMLQERIAEGHRSAAESINGWGLGGSPSLFISPINLKRCSYLSQSWFQNSDSLYQKRFSDNDEAMHKTMIAEADIVIKQYEQDIKKYNQDADAGIKYAAGLKVDDDLTEADTLSYEVNRCIETREKMSYCSTYACVLQGVISDKTMPRTITKDIMRSKQLNDNLDSLSSTRAILVSMGSEMKNDSCFQRKLLNRMQDHIELICSITVTKSDLPCEVAEQTALTKADFIINDDQADWAVDEFINYIEMDVKDKKTWLRIAGNLMDAKDFEKSLPDERRITCQQFVKNQIHKRAKSRYNSKKDGKKESINQVDAMGEILSGRINNIITDSVRSKEAKSSLKGIVIRCSDDRIATLIGCVSQSLHNTINSSLDCRVSDGKVEYAANRLVVDTIVYSSLGKCQFEIDGSIIGPDWAKKNVSPLENVLYNMSKSLDGATIKQSRLVVEGCSKEDCEYIVIILSSLIALSRRQTGMSDYGSINPAFGSLAPFYYTALAWHNIYASINISGLSDSFLDPDNLLISDCSLINNLSRYMEIVKSSDETTANELWQSYCKDFIQSIGLSLLISKPTLSTLFSGTRSRLVSNPSASATDMKFIEMARFLLDMKSRGLHNIFDIAIHLLQNNYQIANRISCKEQRGGPRGLDVNNTASILVNRVVEMVSELIAVNLEGELLAKPYEKYKVIGQAESDYDKYKMLIDKIAEEPDIIAEGLNFNHSILRELIDHSKWGSYLSAIGQSCTLSGFIKSIPEKLRELIRLIALKQQCRKRLMPNTVRITASDQLKPIRSYKEIEQTDNVSKALTFLSAVSVGAETDQMVEVKELYQSINDDFEEFTNAEDGSYKMYTGTGQGIWHKCSTVHAAATVKLVDELIEATLRNNTLCCQSYNFNDVFRTLTRWNQHELIDKIDGWKVKKLPINKTERSAAFNSEDDTTIWVLPPPRLKTTRSSDDSQGFKVCAVFNKFLTKEEIKILCQAYIDCWRNIDKSARALTGQIESGKSIFAEDFTQIYSHFSFGGSAPVANDKSIAGCCVPLMGETHERLISEIHSKCISLLKEGVKLTTIEVFHIYRTTSLIHNSGYKNLTYINHKLDQIELPRGMGGVTCINAVNLIEGCDGLTDRNKWVNLLRSEDLGLRMAAELALSIMTTSDSDYNSDDVIKIIGLQRRIPKLISENQSLKTKRDDLKSIFADHSASMVNLYGSPGLKYIVEKSSALDEDKSIVRIAQNFNLVQTRNINTSANTNKNVESFSWKSAQCIIPEDLCNKIIELTRHNRVSENLRRAAGLLAGARRCKVRNITSTDRPQNSREEVDIEFVDGNDEMKEGRLVSHKLVLQIIDILSSGQIKVSLNKKETMANKQKLLIEGDQMYHHCRERLLQLNSKILAIRQEVQAMDYKEESEFPGYWRHKKIFKQSVTDRTFKNRIEDVLIIKFGLEKLTGVIMNIKPADIQQDLALLDSLLPNLTKECVRTEEDAKLILDVLSSVSSIGRSSYIDLQVFVPKMVFALSQTVTACAYLKQPSFISGEWENEHPEDTTTLKRVGLVKRMTNDLIAFVAGEFIRQRDSSWSTLPVQMVWSQDDLAIIASDFGISLNIIKHHTLLALGKLLCNRLKMYHWERFLSLASINEGLTGQSSSNIDYIYTTSYDEFDVTKYPSCMIVKSKQGVSIIAPESAIKNINLRSIIINFITSISPGTIQDKTMGLKLNADYTTSAFKNETESISLPVDIMITFKGYVSFDSSFNTAINTTVDSSKNNISIYTTDADSYTKYNETINKKQPDDAILTLSVNTKSWTYSERQAKLDVTSFPIMMQLRELWNELPDYIKSDSATRSIYNFMSNKSCGGNTYKIPLTCTEDFWIKANHALHRIKQEAIGLMVSKLNEQDIEDSVNINDNISDSNSSSAEKDELITKVKEAGLGMLLPPWTFTQNDNKNKRSLVSETAKLMYYIGKGSQYLMRQAWSNGRVDCNIGCGLPWSMRLTPGVDVSINPGHVFVLFQSVEVPDPDQVNRKIEEEMSEQRELDLKAAAQGNLMTEDDQLIMINDIINSYTDDMLASSVQCSECIPGIIIDTERGNDEERLEDKEIADIMNMIQGSTPLPDYLGAADELVGTEDDFGQYDLDDQLDDGEEQPIMISFIGKLPIRTDEHVNDHEINWEWNDTSKLNIKALSLAEITIPQHECEYSIKLQLRTNGPTINGDIIDQSEHFLRNLIEARDKEIESEIALLLAPDKDVLALEANKEILVHKLMLDKNNHAKLKKTALTVEVDAKRSRNDKKKTLIGLVRKLTALAEEMVDKNNKISDINVKLNKIKQDKLIRSSDLKKKIYNYSKTRKEKIQYINDLLLHNNYKAGDLDCIVCMVIEKGGSGYYIKDLDDLEQFINNWYTKMLYELCDEYELNNSIASLLLSGREIPIKSDCIFPSMMDDFNNSMI